MSAKILHFRLLETKKHSGKYVLEGTQQDMYPTMMYFKKEWFPNNQLPQNVTISVEASDQ